MHQSIAKVPTANASRYLQQLCKHWSHKFNVSFDPQAGSIALPFGTTDLAANAAALTITISHNSDADPARAQQVVAEHLTRFAFREGELEFNWQSA